MPDIHKRTQPDGAARKPIEAVREQRIDPPHRLGDPPPGEERAKPVDGLPAVAIGIEDDGAESASLVVVQQLRLQAQQLAAHLQQQQADLDRREAQLQAQMAEVQQQERNNRLWLREHHAELNERETELRRRDAELAERAEQSASLEHDRTSDLQREREALVAMREALARREAAIREAEKSVRQRAAEVESAGAAVEDAADAHDQLSRELDERTARFDARQSWCLDALSGFLERGELPVPQAQARTTPRDAFDELADLLNRLAMRRKNLAEAEAVLAQATRVRPPEGAQPLSMHTGPIERQLAVEELFSLLRRLLTEVGR